MVASEERTIRVIGMERIVRECIRNGENEAENIKDT